MKVHFNNQLSQFSCQILLRNPILTQESHFLLVANLNKINCIYKVFRNRAPQMPITKDVSLVALVKSRVSFGSGYLIEEFVAVWGPKLAVSGFCSGGCRLRHTCDLQQRVLMKLHRASIACRSDGLRPPTASTIRLFIKLSFIIIF